MYFVLPYGAGYAIIDLETNKNVGFKTVYVSREDAEKDLEAGKIVPF